MKLNRFIKGPAMIIITPMVIFSWAFADSYLKDLPVAAEAQVIWQDKPFDINNRHCNISRLSMQGKIVQEILDFYRESLPKYGWQFFQEYKPNNTVAFKKDDEFLYVMVWENGKDFPSDVYLITSLVDLAICLELKDLVLKQPIGQDAPGRDFMDVLRFPGSKRRYDFSSGENNGMLMYEAEAEPKEVASFFKRNLKADGWELNPFFSADFLKKRRFEMGDVQILFFQKEEESILINISKVTQAQEKACSFITIIRNIMQDFTVPESPKKEG